MQEIVLVIRNSEKPRLFDRLAAGDSSQFCPLINRCQHVWNEWPYQGPEKTAQRPLGANTRNFETCSRFSMLKAQNRFRASHCTCQLDTVRIPHSEQYLQVYIIGAIDGSLFGTLLCFARRLFDS